MNTLNRLPYPLMLISLPLVWWLVARLGIVPVIVLPGPGIVCNVIWTERAIFWRNTLMTLEVGLLGYLLANILALTLALLFVYIPAMEQFTTPWMVLIKNVPFVTLASILILTLGDQLAPKLVIVVLVCFFPLLANLNKGLRAADPVLLDRLRTLRATRWQTFSKVRWPAALPYYMAAHEIAFTSCLTGAIVAEWFFAREGLGFLLVQSVTEYRADRLYAVTLIAGLLSIGSYLLCRWAERRMFRWQTG
jgi:ABC-type nitrate/sulfonate/bicarbonate transport system permease component